MSSSISSPSGRFARSSKFVRHLAAAYLALVLYASLYPFSGWRTPLGELSAFLFADWPFYVTASDVALNVLAYLPLGLLLTLVLMGRMRRGPAALLGVAAGTLLSFLIEVAQGYLPARISSNLDLLTNSAGALGGAALAYGFGSRWLLSGDLYRLRGRLFHAEAATDVGFLLLALWLLTQLNAEIWLFGNGDLRSILPDQLGLPYTAARYRFLEAGVAAFNFTGVALLLTALARSFAASAVSLAILTGAALALKTIASSALFVPGNPSLWLTPGSLAGLAAGVLAWLLLCRLSRRWLAGVAAACLVSGTVLVNLLPENPYLVAALKVWRHGHYVSFNGMTGLLSLVWPFFAIGYLINMMRCSPAATRQGS